MQKNEQHQLFKEIKATNVSILMMAVYLAFYVVIYVYKKLNF